MSYPYQPHDNPFPLTFSPAPAWLSRTIPPSRPGPEKNCSSLRKLDANSQPLSTFREIPTDSDSHHAPSPRTRKPPPQQTPLTFTVGDRPSAPLFVFALCSEFHHTPETTPTSLTPFPLSIPSSVSYSLTPSETDNDSSLASLTKLSVRRDGRRFCTERLNPQFETCEEEHARWRCRCQCVAFFILFFFPSNVPFPRSLKSRIPSRAWSGRTSKDQPHRRLPSSPLHSWDPGKVQQVAWIWTCSSRNLLATLSVETSTCLPSPSLPNSWIDLVPRENTHA
ncbi:hypothetical protein EDB84DRAFT_400524 [Lactarius hengduanensis]|nr:hypothetical protein EDB84DRAFT_400524 [Lactarius hengduanensis]